MRSACDRGSRGTGAGKSLCYQLPAVVSAGTVLVVSPLLALMRDQLAHLPPGLPAAMLSAGQPRAEARQVLEDLRVRRSACCYCPVASSDSSVQYVAQPLVRLKSLRTGTCHQLGGVWRRAGGQAAGAAGGAGAAAQRGAAGGAGAAAAAAAGRRRRGALRHRVGPQLPLRLLQVWRSAFLLKLQGALPRLLEWQLRQPSSAVCAHRSSHLGSGAT
jgi:hypothetical protein